MNYDPIQGEFFSSQSIADRLVRESIQNSLDARVDTELPVRIRFTLSDRDGLSGGRAGAYFNSLPHHLDAAMEGNAPGRAALERLGDGEPVPYLLIEDFNTTGLIGDVEQFSDPSISGGSDDNHFYWFVRNVGRSGKRGLEGGSWGVGKWVFPDASAINTFFFLTRREDDQREIFMGQAVLKVHTLDRARFFPYGHFAEIEPDSEFALPIGDPVEIHRVKEDFGLTRSGETGLSIVVPFPEEGLDRDSLLRAVIRYYFSPILSDRLLVEVSDSSSGDQGIRVDYDTIYDIIDDIDWSDSGADLTPENRRRMFDLVQDHATVSGQDMITTREPEPNRDPTRTSFSDRFEANLLEEARSRYELGEALTFRIPVWVHPKNDSPRLSRFDLIVQRDVNLEGTHTEYVRNNLTIPEAGPRRLGVSSNFRSLLVVDEGYLAALLRDSEEPSHSRWNERATRVRDNYDLGTSTVRFVNGAVRGVVRCLTVAREGVHRNLLSEFFGIPDNGGGQNPRPRPPNPPSQSPVEISERRGGFNIRVVGEESAQPRQLQIQVAYETRRGSALSRYDPRDFQLDSPGFTVSTDGCHVDGIQLNRMRVSIDRVGARIGIIGFDPNRDLMVQVDAVEPTQ